MAVPLNTDAVELLIRKRGSHEVWVFPVTTKRLIDGKVKEVVAPVAGCSTAAW